jgi:hypothetical protein
VVLSGDVVGVQNPILTADQLDAALGKTSNFSVSVNQSQSEGDEVSVTVVVKKVSANSTPSPLLFALIAEKEVDYAAPNGENLHHNVFRKLLLDENISLDVGDSVVFNENYSIHGDWEADELFVTVMVQNEATGEVLQSAASETLYAGPSSINDEILSMDGMLYPNPTSDVINISANGRERFVRADFYAMTGTLVKSFDQPSSMNISQLPEGIYMAVLVDKDNRRHITRVVKR